MFPHGALVIVLAALSIVGPTRADAAPGVQASIRAAGGVTIRYPASWQVAVEHDGAVVVIAGPIAKGLRPVATVMIADGDGQPAALLARAAGGLGTRAPLRLLGERGLGPGRRARYYLRGDGAAAEYAMVGVAIGGGWVATMVAVDLASDPDLRTRAAVFQAILTDLVMPGGGA